MVQSSGLATATSAPSRINDLQTSKGWRGKLRHENETKVVRGEMEGCILYRFKCIHIPVTSEVGKILALSEISYNLRVPSIIIAFERFLCFVDLTPFFAILAHLGPMYIFGCPANFVVMI